MGGIWSDGVIIGAGDLRDRAGAITGELQPIPIEFAGSIKIRDRISIRFTEVKDERVVVGAAAWRGLAGTRKGERIDDGDDIASQHVGTGAAVEPIASFAADQGIGAAEAEQIVG